MKSGYHSAQPRSRAAAQPRNYGRCGMRFVESGGHAPESAEDTLTSLSSPTPIATSIGTRVAGSPLTSPQPLLLTGSPSPTKARTSASTGGRGTSVLPTPAGWRSIRAPPDTVSGSNLPLETTAEILAKKLRFRMARDKELLPRDLYDIAFARQKAPAALQTALDAVRTDQLGELVEVFKDHRIRADHPDVTAVLSPSDPELAKRSPGIVERIVTRELDQRPPERGLRPELTR